MSILRIESTVANLEENPAPDAFTIEEMNEDIKRYWGTANKERRFLVSYLQALHLIKKSDLKQLALKITNPQTPERVDGIWIPLATSVEVPNYFGTDNEDIYFAFSEALVLGFKETSGRIKVQDLHIVARLGKTVDYEIVIFLIPANSALILNPQSGGGGAISGARLPRKKRR